MEIKRLEDLLTSLLEQESAELVDLKFAKEGSRWVLRAFIDKEGGVTLDDCAYFSDRIGALIDESGLVEKSYVLEVASPGLDRVVKKEKDFKKFIGRAVKLRLKAPQNGRRKYEGRIKGYAEGKVLLDFEGGELVFEHARIDEVRLDYEKDLEF